MSRRKPKLNLTDVLVVSLLLSAVSLVVMREAFVFIGGFTLALGCMYLVIVWDDIAAWWSTRR